MWASVRDWGRRRGSAGERAVVDIVEKIRSVGCWVYSYLATTRYPGTQRCSLRSCIAIHITASRRIQLSVV